MQDGSPSGSMHLCHLYHAVYICPQALSSLLDDQDVEVVLKALDASMICIGNENAVFRSGKKVTNEHSWMHQVNVLPCRLN